MFDATCSVLNNRKKKKVSIYITGNQTDNQGYYIGLALVDVGIKMQGQYFD